MSDGVQVRQKQKRDPTQAEDQRQIQERERQRARTSAQALLSADSHQGKRTLQNPESIKADTDLRQLPR